MRKKEEKIEILDIEDVFGQLGKNHWETIHNSRIERKKQILKYTKHSKKREALIKEIKRLEDVKKGDI